MNRRASGQSRLAKEAQRCFGDCIGIAERRAIEEPTGRAGVVVACERGHWRVFNWGCANEVVPRRLVR